jgi:hypothetical protein
MLAELAGQRILRTCLRPPMTVTDGLRYVSSQLTTAGAADIAGLEPVVSALAEAAHLLAWHNDAAPAERRDLRVTARVGCARCRTSWTSRSRRWRDWRRWTMPRKSP